MPVLLSFATEFHCQSFFPLFLKQNSLSLAKFLLGLQVRFCKLKVVALHSFPTLWPVRMHSITKNMKSYLISIDFSRFPFSLQNFCQVLQKQKRKWKKIQRQVSACSSADLILRMDFGKDFCGIYLSMHFIPAGFPQKL